ncbi:MAG: ribosome maturation factor RimM [Alphaproteobacteria bacterium]
MDLIVVGKIVAPHGLQGAVKLKSFTENPLTLFSFSSLLILEGAPPLKIKKHKPDKEKGTYIAMVEGVISRTQAEALHGQLLHVSKEMLPNLDEDEETFYHTDLVGLEARGLDGRAVGAVYAVHHVGESDVLEIIPQGGDKKASFLIPFTRNFVPEINLSEKCIVLDSWEAASEKDEER